MKWLRSNLLMFSFMVLVSCVVFVANNGTASAMTLTDLQGTYRIVDTDTLWGNNAKGGLVELQNTSDGLAGIAKNSPSNGNGFKAGNKVIYDVWVDGDVIHCKADYSIVSCGWDSTIKIYDNGQSLKIVQDENDHSLFWVLKRVD